MMLNRVKLMVSWFINFLLIVVIFTACQPPKEQTAAKIKPPNIIFILTDDLGYGDLGVLFQNQRESLDQPFHQTPHLDKMAGEGLLLTRHYVPAPVCAPSRASLLLGLHQGHANVRNNQFDKALADNHTMATVLKQAGYTTGIVGKYGLQGLEGNSPETWEAYPTKRGFDHFFGYVRHVDGHNHYPAHEAPARPPVELYHNNEEISAQLQGCYTTDLFTAAAKKWIIDQKQESPTQPFFLYLAYDTPHAGLQVASSPYPEGGGIEGGVQWLGDSGKFINTAGDSIDNFIHPDYANNDWPDQQKRFASMVRRIDEAVADVLQLLKDLNIDQETLVVFSSDNGPHHESYGYGDYQPTFFESYGPLDGTKRDTWEGGIRVPTVVRWPGQIPEGQKDDLPSGFHDWLATFAQLAGIPAPANTDGVSLVPMLTGKGVQEPSKIYIEYTVGGNTPDYESFHSSHIGQLRGEMQVIYIDGYKGIRYNIQNAADDFQIYETKNDAGETNNLAGSSEYFKVLQKDMKERVLQVRRPDENAPRPYDEVPIPSLKSIEGISSGLNYRYYEIATPYTPDLNFFKQAPESTGNSTSFDINIGSRENNIIIEFSGIIEVPETGEYSFFLTTDRGAIFKIHDATVIDADKGYESGSVVSSKIILEKGYHPIQLIYARGEEGRPLLQVEWSGPGFEVRQVEVENLSHLTVRN